MHIIRKHRLGLPQDSRDGFTALEKARLITPELATTMRAMVGFRNIAVHQYQSLSIPVLRSILEGHLTDFNALSSALLQQSNDDP